MGQSVRIKYLLFLSVLLMITYATIIAAERLTDARGKILQDGRLIVPGVGSNSMLLGEDIDDVIKHFGRKAFRISSPGGTGELFKQVFNVSSNTKIYFNSIYYNDDRKSAACVYRDRVVAIIGFDNDCITIDTVDLKNGINSYIFHYGNRNLSLIKGGANGIYLYPELGIAVADDGMDDTIDLYIVFPSRGDMP